MLGLCDAVFFSVLLFILKHGTNELSVLFILVFSCFFSLVATILFFRLRMLLQSWSSLIFHASPSSGYLKSWSLALKLLWNFLYHHFKISGHPFVFCLSSMLYKFLPCPNIQTHADLLYWACCLLCCPSPPFQVCSSSNKLSFYFFLVTSPFHFPFHFFSFLH